MAYVTVVLYVTFVFAGVYLFLRSMMILAWIVGEYDERMKGRSQYGFWNFVAGALPVVLTSPRQVLSFLVFWPRYDWFQDEPT